jgi:xanthine dehydrogenase accessory factor
VALHAAAWLPLAMPRFFTLLAQAVAEGQPFALGIITRTQGSTPQKQGAKALFLADGRMQGTLGGGCLEAEVQARAQKALVTGHPEAFELTLNQAFGWDDGLLCGGTACVLVLPHADRAANLWHALAQGTESLTWGVKKDFSIVRVTERDEGDWRYQETVAPPVALWIAGSGHIARAVAPLAVQLEFDVTVFDDRPTLVHPQFFPPDAHLRADTWKNLLTEPLPRNPVFGLIVTRGHQHDGLVLQRWIRQPFAFLGMIGSQRKRRMLFDQFVADQLAIAEQLARVACPVGLPIQALSPQEIAVSIMAQYIQQRAELVKVPPR